ncbi:MAG: hypothetical protein PSU94_05815 [Lacunisphaera sp.]|nr:hypothetical protein [Lacunisphaera sp.]
MPKMRLGQLLLLAWLGGVLLLWQYLASGGLSFSESAFTVSIPLGGYFLGDLFLKFALQDNERLDNLPARLACGIILADVLLYVSVLALPFGPALDWGLIFVAALIGWVLARRSSSGSSSPAGIGPEAIFLFLAPVAVTFWCRELLSPVQPDGPVVVIRAWQDIYSHVCLIADFAASRGMGTISDLHGAGIPSLPYHQAAYMLSAALVDGAGVSALAAYAGLMVPLGLLVAACAGYALAAAVFGRWPALAGGLALLLLPDAVQQGAGNPFLGYQWMQQSAPACGYGLACAALVFALLHEACRAGRYRLVAFGWLFVAFTLLHKAQFFFAIAYLALIFPSLFLAGLSTRHRILSLLLLTGIYGVVIAASQTIPSVPVIRLDGSGLMSYSRLILNNQADGFLQQIFTALFANAAGNWPYRAAAFVLLLTIVTFGAHALVYLVQVRQLRRTDDRRVWLFPLLVAAFYLAMAAGLALDDRQLGTSVELLHRPFLWAYFVMVLWVGAVTYRRFFRDAPPATMGATLALASVALALLLVPATFGTGIQTMKHWGFGHQRLPAGQIAAANFIRANSARGDLVQEGRTGICVILSALCERRAFAITTSGAREPAELGVRLKALEELNGLRDARLVEAFMQQHSIRWYVINPGDQVPWADTLGRPPVFESDGYRVFRF